MQRTALGTIATALIVLGAALWFADPSHSSATAGGLLRAGIVLFALWLALPQLRALPRWMLLTVLGALAVVIYRPKALLFVLPILILLPLLRPRFGRPPPGEFR